jgi:hypothetical protein
MSFARVGASLCGGVGLSAGFYMLQQKWNRDLEAMVAEAEAELVKEGKLGGSSTPEKVWPKDERDLSLPELEAMSVQDGLVHVATYLDRQASTWEEEVNSFKPSTSDAFLQERQLQVFRMKMPYAGPTHRPSQGVPSLRIVGFLPNVTTSTVYKYLTTPEIRLEWDPNYRAFTVLQSNNSGSSPTDGVQTDKNPPPEEKGAAKKKAVDKKATGKQALAATAPPPQLQPFPNVFHFNEPYHVSSQLMTHTLSSKFFERLGIKPRVFLYDMWTVKYTDPRFAKDNQPTTMIFRSRDIAQTIDALPPDSEAKKILLDRTTKAPLEVFMHYQHIMLIPISSRGQLTGCLERFRRTGAIRTLPTAAELEGLTKKTGETSQAPAGVLMMLSSVNDAKVARMPRFAEKQVAKFFGSLAQSSMLDYIEKQGDVIVPKPNAEQKSS